MDWFGGWINLDIWDPCGGINCLSFSVGPVSVGAVWMLQFGCWGRERGGGDKDRRREGEVKEIRKSWRCFNIKCR